MWWQGLAALYTQATVEVHFLPADLTDFPIFTTTLQTLQVSESTPVGSVVHTVRAVSPDSSQIAYHIAGGNQDHSFYVTSAGDIKVASGLNYERVRVYGLWVEARDNNDPPRSAYWRLNVEIRDENDNAPQFEETEYIAIVMEEEVPPQTVTTVTATDADAGSNARVTYELIGGNNDGSFAIDEVLGRIRTVRTLDREAIDHFSLVVAARDHVCVVLYCSIPGYCA